MNKLFQQMNKIEAEITAGLKDDVRDETDGPVPAVDHAPSVAAAVPTKAAAAEPGSEAALRQQLRKVEARLNEKVRVQS